MKMTVDLPDDLLRQLKLQAVLEGKKLKILFTESLRRGLAMKGNTAVPTTRHRVKLPIIPAFTGATSFELTAERIHDLEMESEMESYAASLRH